MDPSQLSVEPRLRYRKLSHPDESGTPLDMVLAGDRRENPGVGIRGAAEAAGAVHELGTVTNGSGTVAEICALIANGTLSPEDLVNDGTGWQSLDEHPAFDDACEPFRSRARWGQRLGLAIAVVAVLGFLLVRIAAAK